MDKFLDPDQTADFLGIQARTLAIWRLQNAGPGFYLMTPTLKADGTPQTVGTSPVRYRLSELETWLEKRYIPAEYPNPFSTDPYPRMRRRLTIPKRQQADEIIADERFKSSRAQRPRGKKT